MIMKQSLNFLSINFILQKMWQIVSTYVVEINEMVFWSDFGVIGLQNQWAGMLWTYSLK